MVQQLCRRWPCFGEAPEEVRQDGLLPACSVVVPSRPETVKLATQVSPEVVLVSGTACVGSAIAEYRPQQFIGPLALAADY